ncbi:MAG: glycoside hydrolase family 3 C-terminal domain-containing protein [Bacteroidales bacterium]|nr:glycoside hydrolase family 3 C-terminal domain-containing protein [Bacteroidales bacterium]
MKTLKSIVCALVCTLALSCGKKQPAVEYEYPFQNPYLSTEERVDNLISLLTLEEKVSMMINRSMAVERLGIPAYNWWGEACHGLMGVSDVTVFPQCIGLAATFDDDAQLTTYTMVSDEARGRYNSLPRTGDIGPYVSAIPNLTFWCPNVNIFRDPRWGRGQETYGEDPYLTSRMGVNVVRGMQGDDDDYFKTHACAKHYAVHSGPEPLRHQFNAVVSGRDLWETYLPAFKALVVEGNVQEVMCAYSAYEGEPCCASGTLLQDILRDKWGYDGIILSDCDAIDDFYVPGRHNTHADAASASADAVLHGTDLECGKSYKALVESVEKGLIRESDIDAALRHILTGRFTLGLLDPDELVPYSNIPGDVVDCQAHRDHALKLAQEGIVMLKNEGGVLPLSKDVKKIAVVGPNIDDLEVMRGNYSGTPTHFVSILKGIQDKLPDAEIYFEKGSEIENEYIQFPKTQLVTSEGQQGFKAVYYGNTNFAGTPIVTTHVENVNFQTEGGYGFGDGVPTSDFSAKYTGTFVPDFTGNLCFEVRSNNCEILVDGKKIGTADFSSFFRRGPQNVIAIDVEEGHSYNIELRFVASGFGGRSMISANLIQRKLAEFDELKEKVKDADAIIFAGGISPTEEGEGHERSTIELPAVQQRFLKAMKETGKPVIFVSCSGSCIGFEQADPYYDALLQAWYSGQEGGTAIADIIFGDVNPSGKLPVTFYKSTSQLPDFMDYSMDNRTYRYFKGEPMYAFGYGMSYSEFSFGKAKLSKSSIKAGKSVDITVPVTNNSTVAGDEIVQIYVKSLDNPDAPIKALKAYKRVSVAPGKTVKVKLTLAPESFAYYSEDVDDLAVFAGKYQILYGNSSRDEDLQAVDFEVI